MTGEARLEDIQSGTLSSEVLRDETAVEPLFWRMMDGSAPMRHGDASQTQKLEQKFLEGKQRGFAEAIPAARRDAESKLAPVLERLTQSIAELAATRQRLRDETAAELVRLSIAIASRILHREITIDPDAVHGLLKAAFDKAQTREITRVLVNPAQDAAVRRFLAQTSGSAVIEIVADARLANGAVLLETTHGQLDASLDTQLREIERGLADSIQG